jgi:hypothetical protein
MTTPRASVSVHRHPKTVNRRKKLSATPASNHTRFFSFLPTEGLYIIRLQRIPDKFSIPFITANKHIPV